MFFLKNFIFLLTLLLSIISCAKYDPVTGEKEKPDPSQVLARTLTAKEYDCVKEALGWKDGKLGDCKFKSECEALA